MTEQPHDWDAREDDASAPVRRELDALRARHRQDPPIDLLRAADADALPDDLQQAIASRLERDRWQRTLVDNLNDTTPDLDHAAEDRLLARIHQEAARDSSARVVRFPVVWRPILALAAAAVLVTAVVLRMHPPTTTPEPATTTTGTPAASPATPSFVLTLDKPDVRLTANALVRRGAGQQPKFVDDVAPALNAYRAGDYQTAEREFERVARLYPDAIEIAFYHGVTQLWLNDPTGAMSSLEAARRLNDETFAPDIAWYLAVANERAGNVAAARSELTTLCAGSSDYRARACDAVARLK